MKYYKFLIELDERQMQVIKDNGMLILSICAAGVLEKNMAVDEEEPSTQSEAGGSFFDFFHCQIERLRNSGCVRTSETYRAALRKFQRFRNGEDLSPVRIDTELMEGFQTFLRNQNLCLNTISFYMRILRAVYRRCVNMGMTRDRHPFRNVYTGIAKTVKRALLAEDVQQLNKVELASPDERFARDMFMLSFYLRGMSFVDMAYLRKSDLQDGVITYKRHKTGQMLSIRMEPQMETIISRYQLKDSPYMLPIIGKPGVGVERNQYRTMQTRINLDLKTVAKKAGLKRKLTMYCARHSWASIARDKQMPISAISMGMGHANERTTGIYLSTVSMTLIDDCNREIINSVT